MIIRPLIRFEDIDEARKVFGLGETTAPAEDDANEVSGEAFAEEHARPFYEGFI